MQESNNLSSSHEAAKRSGSNDLTVCRRAGGAALNRLCREISTITSPYQEINIRGPGKGFSDPARVEVVDQRSVGACRLRQRGITKEKTRLAMSRLVPSILLAQPVKATEVDVDFSRSREYYIALQFSDDDANKLINERRKVWTALSILGKFSINRIPWLDRIPDVRLAYIPTDSDIPSPHDMVEKVEATIEAALPLDLLLAGAYDSDSLRQE